MLPTLQELRDIDSINAELDLGEPGVPMTVVEGDGMPSEEGEEGEAHAAPELEVIDGSAGEEPAAEETEAAEPEEEDTSDNPTLH